MPLIKSKSKEAISKNIATEMHAGKPQKQSIAIAYNVKKADGGSLMPNMMDGLMAKRRKKLAEGGRTEPDEDFNTDPDLKLDSSQLSNDSRFDDLLSDEQDRLDDIDNNEAKYAAGGTVSRGVAYNANLKENEGVDESQSHDEDSSIAYDDGGSVSQPSQPNMVDPNKAKAFSQGFTQQKARGGVVSPHEDENNIPAKSDGEENPMNPLKKSGKAYQPKQIGNQGRPTIDLNDHRYAKGGIAYDNSVKEPEQDDTPELHDEDSDIAMAQGGNVGKNRVAYNSEIPYKPQLDTMEDHDEASDIAMAEGGDVNSERHLHPDMEDTAESKDEASSHVMAEGGNMIDLEGHEEADSSDESAEKHLSPDLEDTYKESHDESSSKLAGGGQINDDQSSGMNPKSMQNESEQESAIKARRRKLMIDALND